ncbi:nuclease HARBI1-like protein [Aphelenchoides avenae]|nr:nuclease HARBI1-like protein [Aphelenchus avenae]
MTVPAFDKLLGLLEDRLRKKSVREPIHPEQRLMVTLKFLATGSSLRSLAFDFFLGETTVRNVVYETCKAIHEDMLAVYWRAISDEFYSRWNLPNALGANASAHVRIKAPENSGSLFYNYKQYFSMVLVAIADARSRVIYTSTLGRTATRATQEYSTAATSPNACEEVR